MRLFDAILRARARSRAPTASPVRPSLGARLLRGSDRPSVDALDRSAFREPGLPPALAYLESWGESAVPRVDRSPLTAAESRAVGRALAELPEFPRNVLNGCQSRAHVTFLRLDAAAPGKVHKVWLFSGQLVSPFARSSIDYALPNGHSSHWNFHVAVAYTASDGQSMVVDTLMSRRPQHLEAWSRRFVYQGFAVALFTRGQSYSFIVSPLRLRGVSRHMLSGFFEYTGVTKLSRDGAKAIAADALALAFSRGKFRGCSWADRRSDAIALIEAVAPYLQVPTWEEASETEQTWLDAIESGGALPAQSTALLERPLPPDDCRAAFQLFQRQVEIWAALGL